MWKIIKKITTFAFKKCCFFAVIMVFNIPWIFFIHFFYDLSCIFFLLLLFFFYFFFYDLPWIFFYKLPWIFFNFFLDLPWLFFKHFFSIHPEYFSTFFSYFNLHFPFRGVLRAGPLHRGGRRPPGPGHRPAGGFSVETFISTKVTDLINT